MTDNIPLLRIRQLGATFLREEEQTVVMRFDGEGDAAVHMEFSRDTLRDMIIKATEAISASTTNPTADKPSPEIHALRCERALALPAMEDPSVVLRLETGSKTFHHFAIPVEECEPFRKRILAAETFQKKMAKPKH